MHFLERALALLLWHLSVCTSEYSSQGQCSPAQQREALADASSCEPRPSMINLREHLPDTSGIIQVIPQYKAVSRCGGSCELYSQGCFATATRTKFISVMVVSTRFDLSGTETECGVVEVEEHTACSCSCPVRAEDCSADDYFDESGCRCLCKDQSGRNRLGHWKISNLLPKDTDHFQ